MEGIAHAIESYRQFTSQAQVKRFETSDHSVTQRGDTAVVEYAWQMTRAAPITALRNCTPQPDYRVRAR